MKIILPFLLLLSIGLAVNTNSYNACIERRTLEDNVVCGKECQKEIDDECGMDTSTYNNANCRYLVRNAGLDDDIDWSDRYRTCFHVCKKKCIDNLEGTALDYMEIIEECSSQKLGYFIGLYLVIILSII